MSIKKQLIKKIYESDLSIKDKITIIKELKDTPEKLVEMILIEGFPVELAKKLTPDKLGFLKAKWNHIVPALMKTKGLTKDAAELAAKRMLGI